MDCARYLRRRVRFGSLEVHPHLNALIVYYSLEAHVLDDSDLVLMSEQRQAQKLIHLENLQFLSDNSDLKPLVKEVLNKCHLIHASKEAELEQLIFYLRKRKPKSATIAHNSHSESIKNSKKKQVYPMQLLSRPTSSSSVTEELANLNHLEQYMELLYEENAMQLRGSQFLLQLAKNPDNLDELANNEPLIGSLSRVLREDGRDEMRLEIITNIVYIFFCFSTFADFHDSILATNKIGALVMDTILFHISKIDKKRNNEEDVLGKIEQLIHVSLFLLLNLAWERSREEKMRRKGIIAMLNAVLKHCRSTQLLNLALLFLKKLSSRFCNVRQMRETATAEICTNLMERDNNALSQSVLSLLLNLSFDVDTRCQMSHLPALISNVVKAMKNLELRENASALLYHLSMEDKVKSLLANTELMAILVRAVLEPNNESIPVEVMALAINMSMHRRSASLILKGAGLQMVMQRAFHYQDALLLKLVRNLSQHKEFRGKFVDFLPDLADAVQKTDNFDFALECLGILANVDLDNIDFKRLLDQYQLLPFLKAQLIRACDQTEALYKQTTPNFSKMDEKDCENLEITNDLGLEAVMFLGTCCLDESAALMICEHNLIPVLIELLKCYQEDDEIVLQVVYVLKMMCGHKSTLERMLGDEEAVAHLLDLLHDKNCEVQRVCDEALTRIGAISELWLERVRRDKFEFHNAQWLQIIDNDNKTIFETPLENEEMENNQFVVKDKADLDSLYMQGPPSDLDLLSTASTASNEENSTSAN